MSRRGRYGPTREELVKSGPWASWTGDDPFPRCEPRIMPVRGGVMARTPEDHPYGLAVIEPTEAAALSAFETMLDRWTELHDQASALDA